MFTKSLKSLAAIAAVTLVSLVPMTGTANAGAKFQLHIGNGHSGIYIGNPHYRQRYVPVRPRHRACGPKRALRKAWHMGVNRPYIARVNQRKIVVRGHSYGYQAKVVFKKGSPNCRVLKVRGL